jgi:hypothetical protein
MNDPKDYLRKMIDSTVAGDKDGARDAFKQFIVPRSADFLNTDQEAEKATASKSTEEPTESKTETEAE